MSPALSDLDHLHDFTIARTTIGGSTIEFDCVDDSGGRHVVVRFEGVREFQFVDLALGSILQEVSEVEPNDELLAKYPAAGKLSVAAALAEADERSEGLRLWRLQSSYGLDGLILATEVALTLR